MRLGAGQEFGSGHFLLRNSFEISLVRRNAILIVACSDMLYESLFG